VIVRLHVTVSQAPADLCTVSPTKTSTKILCFPLALIGIALIASQVSDILGFFGESARHRKAELRKEFEKSHQQVSESLDPAAELIAEMKHLQNLYVLENAASRLYDASLSLAAFALFWFIGALVFAEAEGWTYGNSLYFWYVFLGFVCSAVPC
jgi:potassium channel subfamily K